MDNASYMIFVLGYDLLQNKLANLKDCACDVGHKTCALIYDEFVDSEENQQEKSEYKCLQD